MRISDWSSDVCSSDLFSPPSSTISEPSLPRKPAGSKKTCGNMSLGISHVLLLILFGNINLARQLKVSRVVAHFLFSSDGMIADLNRLFSKLTKSSFIKSNCIYIQSINTKRPQAG